MSSETQNFQNHRRYVFGYHVEAAALVLAYLVYALYSIFSDFSAASVFNLVLALAVGLIGFYAREFALRSQDRTIRLEERLRLSRLMPEDLRSRIDSFSTPQLVALRFAPDSELPDLARRVLTEQISEPDDIKKLIKEWRPDHQRV